MKRYEQGTLGMQKDKQGAWCEYEEANAEIERLRDQVTRLSTLVDTERSLHDAEIERLRGHRAKLLAEIDKGEDEIESQRAEIERLQGNNERLLLDNLELRNEIAQLRKELLDTTWQDHADHWQKLTIQKDAEIERLRAAFEVRERDHKEKTAEIERLRWAADKMYDIGFTAARKTYAAEIERLRKALGEHE